MTTDFSHTRRAAGSVPASYAEGRRSPLTEFAWFLIVGGGAALGFIVMSAVMVEWLTGVPDWIVSAGCYGLFIVPVYLAHRRFSFRSGAPHAVALPRYVAVQLSALGLATLFSYVCYAILGMPPATAALLVIALTSGVNFVVLKLWAFAHRG